MDYCGCSCSSSRSNNTIKHVRNADPLGSLLWQNLYLHPPLRWIALHWRLLPATADERERRRRASRTRRRHLRVHQAVPCGGRGGRWAIAAAGRASAGNAWYRDAQLMDYVACWQPAGQGMSNKLFFSFKI